MISLDTETTGLDMYHGARPYFVTMCLEDGEQRYWEWDVDPLTREVQIDPQDAKDLLADLCFGPDIVLQNAKFDIAMLRESGIVPAWNWSRTHDTLIAGHLLASNQPHDLTSMAMQYLGVDIEPLEKALEAACKECRRIVQQARLRGNRRAGGLFDEGETLAPWQIAEKGLPGMPSAKESCWKMDTWLPKALAEHFLYGPENPGTEDDEKVQGWLTVLRDYANGDSAVTLALWKAQEAELHRRGLWEVYLERLKVLPVACKMEADGVTVSRERLDRLKDEYAEESELAGKVCVNLAAGLGHELTLPKSGNNGSLTKFCFEGLKLPVLKASKKTGVPSLDKAALEEYEHSLPEKSKALTFVKALKGKRKRDTATAYMEGYEKFWLPVDKHPDWFVMHPSLNPTGTDTLRWSSSNPNEQNISKQEGFNLRFAFGPPPGREWWSLDAQNIELRIPSFEAGEPVLMDVFNRPNDPPYFGSYHLAIFDVLHPQLFKEHGKACKDKYKATLYQWIKNGNFAIIYGAQEETADRSYHVPGAYARIRHRFPKIAALNDRMIRFAGKHGYVETLPDKTVNPNKGYPLLCTRTERGQVMPTVPLNYHVQGTAMWWMAKAMVRCQEKLDEWNALGFDGRIALQVHDELVFDFPKRGDPAKDRAEELRADPQWKIKYQSNLWRVNELRRLMFLGGKDIGVPTPVSCEWHADNWSEGVTL